MMAAGHPHCYVATASVGYPIDLMNKVRKGLNFKGASFLMIYTPCQKGFVYETPRSIDLGRLVVECGLLPDLGMEQREARVRLQLPPAEHAAGVRVPEAAGTLRPPARRAHRDAAEVRQPAVADDGRRRCRRR